MAHGRDKRLEVRRAYVQDRLPLKAAADAAKVAYATARAWKREAERRGDHWDRARLADQVSDGGAGALTRIVLEEFVPLFESTIKQVQQGDLNGIEKAEVLTRLADAYSKTIKASGAVDPALAKLSWAMEVIKRLAQFVAERFPCHQEAVLEILEPFGEVLAHEYG